MNCADIQPVPTLTPISKLSDADEHRFERSDMRLVSKLIPPMFMVGSCMGAITALTSKSQSWWVFLIQAAVFMFGVAVWHFRLNFTDRSFAVVSVVATFALDFGFIGDKSSASPTLAFYLAMSLAFFMVLTPRMAIVMNSWLSAHVAVMLAISPKPDALVARWAITTGIMVMIGSAILVGRYRNRALLREIAETARRDALTGVLNRRGMRELFEVEVDRARRYGRDLTVLMVDIDHFKRINDTYGHQRGDDVLATVGQVFATDRRSGDIVARYGGEEFAFVLPEIATVAGITVAERIRESIETAVFMGDIGVTVSIGIASFPAHGNSPDELLAAADQALYAAKALGRNRSIPFDERVPLLVPAAQSAADEFEGTRLRAMLELLETLHETDGYDRGHSTAVANLAEDVARELGLPEQRVRRVRLAGLLHDIGKLGVDGHILRKKGPLNDEEWGEIRRHPGFGSVLLDKAGMPDVQAWVAAHHERWDGNGYPKGLKETEIPVEARILAVVDAWDAMTSDRAYRAALTNSWAVNELRRCSGTQFDPDVVDAFHRVLAKYAEELRLSDEAVDAA